MKHLSNMLFIPFFSIVGGDGIDGSGGEGEGETISKADHDKQIGELKTQLDDFRAEVVSPDYLEFLEAKGKPAKKEPVKVEAKAADANSVIAELQTQVKELKENFTKADGDRTAKEIAEFADTHEDFESMKPIMIGISADPKFKNASLSKLYKEAKSYVQKKEDEIKERLKSGGKKPSSEKPAGSGTAFDPNKKYTPDEAAREAAREIEEAGGVF